MTGLRGKDSVRSAQVVDSKKDSQRERNELFEVMVRSQETNFGPGASFARPPTPPNAYVRTRNGSEPPYKYAPLVSCPVEAC